MEKINKDHQQRTWKNLGWTLQDLQTVTSSFRLLLSSFGFKLRGEKLNDKSVAKEISKPPFFGSWSPVGIKVYRVCLIHVSFKCSEPRPYLVCHVTTIENV